MKTFQELYCATHRCRSEKFGRQIFWQCLHRWAVLPAPILLLLRPSYFEPDREFIGEAGRTASLRQLDEEIRDFAMDSRNRNWWRRRIRWRVSTYRLRRLAARYLPGDTAGNTGGAK